MSNTINPRPLEPLLAEFQRLGLSFAAMLLLREHFTRVDKVLTNQGEVQAVAPVKGRTEGLGTTVGKLDTGGLVIASGLDFTRAYTNKTLDNINDGASFARVSTSALNGNQVDLSKSGVINQVSTDKIVNNAMLNSSNNATVDSIDNGVNATIRVYGSSGGPGTTWNLTIGPITQPGLPSFSGAFNYSTDYIVYWDGSSFHVILASNAFAALADKISFTGVVHTVAAGGGGGVSGGGSTTGGNKGRLTAIQ